MLGPTNALGRSRRSEGVMPPKSLRKRSRPRKKRYSPPHRLTHPLWRNVTPSESVHQPAVAEAVRRPRLPTRCIGMAQHATSMAPAERRC